MRTSAVLLTALVLGATIAAGCNGGDLVGSGGGNGGNGGGTPTPGSSAPTSTPTPAPPTPLASPGPSGSAQLIIRCTPTAQTMGMTGTLHGDVIDMSTGAVVYTGDLANATMTGQPEVDVNGIVPAGYYVRAWLDVNQDAAEDAGDASMSMGEVYHDVTAGSTTQDVFVDAVE